MFKKTVISFIKFYQKLKSSFQENSSCRYSPTCSEYASIAIKKYGILKGVFLGVGRILKCHPLSKGGYDPVK